MKITNEQYDPRTGLILFEVPYDEVVFCCSISPKELDPQEWASLALDGTKMLTRFNERRPQIENAASTAIREARKRGIVHRPGVKTCLY